MAGQAVPHVATVVLSWNGRNDTLACLRSLAELDWPRHTAIVVDNGSTDGTAAAVETDFPDVVVVETGHNLGFAEGNNAGLQAALAIGADYVLLLNNDTVVDPALLTELVDEAERRPDAGALCPLIYYLDPPDRIWYAGARFDARRGHNGRHTGYGERDEGQYTAVRETGRGTGAAMLVRRAVIEQVGFLDGELFLQVEDVEWSLRMRAVGWRIFFVPAARVWHKVSRTTGGEHAPATAYYEVRNTLAVCDRYAPRGGLARLRRASTVLGVAVVHARLARRPAVNIRAAIDGLRDWRDGRLGPRPQSTATPPAIAPAPDEAAAGRLPVHVT
jgi:GT2 family glycosyltransferase